MIMTDRYVWHPQKSIANDESEDGGRGSLVLHAEQQDVDPQLKKKRKKAIIQRRKTPTVDVRVLLSQASARTKSNRSKEKLKARDTYETIETQEGPGPSILECSSIVYRMKPQTSTTFPENELCGWRDRELESYKPAANRSMTFSSFDRSRLQTPATGLRSNLQSRARSTPHPSSRGKRREPYVFQHFSETHHYIEHYRIFHSYTTLTVPGLKNKLCTCTDKAIAGEEFLQGEPPPEPKVVEQDSDGIVQPEVKSYSHEDPYAYLRELVSRLGVQTLAESTPKPTPPSITKKTKHNEDLVVCSNRDMNREKGSPSTDEPVSSSYQDSTKLSKSARTSAGHNKAVGLPQIAQTTHIPTAAVARKSRGSSDSVISVNKYLQVRSPHQASLPEENKEEGEKEMEETEIKPDSFPYHQTSRTTTLSSTSGEIVQLLPESREPSNSFHNAVEFNTPNSASMKLAAMQEQLMTLDSSQKEKLLSNKAHTLGLTSRSWAKTAKAKRILGNHTTERAHGEVTTPQHQSYIKQEETSYRQSLNSRPHTRMAGAVRNETRTTMKDHSTNSTTRRRQEQSEPAPGVERDREGGSRRAHGDHTQKASAKQSESSKRREEDRKKLEQLRGIYDSSRNNRNHVYSRCPTRQASRCAKTRPATRASTSGWEEGTKKCQPKANRSRPVTQLGRSRGRAFIKDVTDLQLEQQRLDESCCWNEIPQKTNFRSETRPVQSSKPLDFDLDNIMLRARHRNQSGVAMVTVRLRNHKQSRRPADGAIVPGASPREIAEHTARANRRFNGLLRVQKPLAPT